MPVCLCVCTFVCVRACVCLCVCAQVVVGVLAVRAKWPQATHAVFWWMHKYTPWLGIAHLYDVQAVQKKVQVCSC